MSMLLILIRSLSLAELPRLILGNAVLEADVGETEDGHGLGQLLVAATTTTTSLLKGTLVRHLII